MKTIFVLIVIFFIAGCKKNIDDEIISTIRSIQDAKEIESTTADAVLLSDMYYFYKTKIYCFSVYYTLHKDFIYAVVDNTVENGNITLVKNYHDILKYIKPSIKYKSIKKSIFSSGVIYSLVLDILDVSYPSDNLINQNEDIYGLKNQDIRKLERIQISPLKKIDHGDSLEIQFFTWSLDKRLFKNKIIISDSLNWERSQIAEDIGAIPRSALEY